MGEQSPRQHQQHKVSEASFGTRSALEPIQPGEVDELFDQVALETDFQLVEPERPVLGSSRGMDSRLSALIAEEEQALRQQALQVHEELPAPEPEPPAPAPEPEPPAPVLPPPAGSLSAPAPALPAGPPAPRTAPLPRRRPWPWLVAAAMALVLVATGFFLVEVLYTPAPRPLAQEPLSVSVSEAEVHLPQSSGPRLQPPAPASTASPASVSATEPRVRQPEPPAPAPAAERVQPVAEVRSGPAARVPAPRAEPEPAAPPRTVASPARRQPEPPPAAEPTREPPPQRKLSFSLATEKEVNVSESPDSESSRGESPEQGSQRAGGDFGFDDALDKEFEEELGFSGSREDRSPQGTRPRRTVWIPPEPGQPSLESLTSLHLKQSVAPHEGELEACFRQHAAGSRVRRLVLRWRIQGDGTTSHVALENRALQGTPLARCLEAQVQSWRFPPHRVPSERPVRLTFTF